MRESNSSRGGVAVRTGGARSRRRRLARFGASLVVVLVASLLSAESEVAAAGGARDIRVFGPPDGQHGLTVNRYLCSSDAPPTGPAWPFHIVGGSPWGESWQPHAIAWSPTELLHAQGVEAYFAAPTQVDVFNILTNGAAGQDIGFANVWYDPPEAGVSWQGNLMLDAGIPGWGSYEVADESFTWYRFTNGQYDNTTATGTVADFTRTHGGNGRGAYFSFNFGCDGKPFAVDGFEVGSSAAGWDAYNFEGYRSGVGLSARRSTTDRCALSVRKFPREVTFKGSLSEPGGWRGWQYAGVGRASKWVPVPKAKGSTSGRFSFRAKVAENSWFDAAYGPTSTHEYSDSRDIYLPAFPSIQLKTKTHSVTRGRQLVVTGAFRPARRLAFDVLLAVPKGNSWGALRKIKSLRADQRGRFRFTVPTGRLGWASIDVFTKTGLDLTTTISRRSVLYKVVKPKAPKPKKTGPSTTPSTNDNTAASGNQNDEPVGGIHGRDHRVVLERPKGYGGCGWRLTGRPPSRLALGRSLDQDGPPVAVKAPSGSLSVPNGGAPAELEHAPSGADPTEPPVRRLTRAPAASQPPPVREGRP